MVGWYIIGGDRCPAYRQTIRKLNVDVAVNCEPCRNYGSVAWVNVTSRNAAIWAFGRQAIKVTIGFPGGDFVRAKVNAIYIYSWYVSPSATIAPYEEMLDSLVLNAVSMRGP